MDVDEDLGEALAVFPELRVPLGTGIRSRSHRSVDVRRLCGSWSPPYGIHDPTAGFDPPLRSRPHHSVGSSSRLFVTQDDVSSRRADAYEGRRSAPLFVRDSRAGKRRLVSGTRFLRRLSLASRRAIRPGFGGSVPRGRISSCPALLNG